MQVRRPRSGQQRDGLQSIQQAEGNPSRSSQKPSAPPGLQALTSMHGRGRVVIGRRAGNWAAGEGFGEVIDLQTPPSTATRPQPSGQRQPPIGRCRRWLAGGGSVGMDSVRRCCPPAPAVTGRIEASHASLPKSRPDWVGGSSACEGDGPGGGGREGGTSNIGSRSQRLGGWRESVARGPEAQRPRAREGNGEWLQRARTPPARYHPRAAQRRPFSASFFAFISPYCPPSSTRSAFDAQPRVFAHRQLGSLGSLGSLLVTPPTTPSATLQVAHPADSEHREQQLSFSPSPTTKAKQIQHCS